MQREKYIDIAKGIGILLVIFCHVISFCDITELKFIFRFCYSFHMPLFFFITGYCGGLKKDTGEKPKLSQNIRKISATLLLPYFVWSVVYLFIDGKIFKAERLKALFTTRGIAPIWFLATLFFCQFFYFILKSLTYKVKSKNANIIFACAALIFLGLSFVMYHTQSVYGLSTKSMGTTLYYLYIAAGRLFISIPVLIGGYLFSKGKVLFRLKKIPCLLLGTALITAVYFAVDFSDLEINLHLFSISNFPVFIFTAFAGATAILMISYSLPSVTKIISLIGTNSIYFMLLHYTPFKTMSISTQTFDFISNPVVFWICSSILTMLITAAGTWVLKRGFFLGKKLNSK